MECIIDEVSSQKSFLLLVIICLIAGVMFAVLQVQPREHALENHSTSEVIAIRKCVQNQGPFMQFRERDKITFHLLCRLDDGRIGDQIVEKTENGLVEKTSFIPQDGTLNSIIKWLFRKGATRFGGNIQ